MSSVIKIDVPPEELRHLADILSWYPVVDFDVLGAGYEPEPILAIIRDNVKLPGLFGRYY